jgi:hypothetical protein
MKVVIQGGTLVALFLVNLTLVHRASPGQKKPETETVKQPLPFSHSQHVTIGLDCSLCHRMAGSGEEAGLPTVADCMNCHQTIKTDSPAVRVLATYYKDGTEIPWIRLCKLPAFVFFSHKKHAGASIHCESCHGPVRLEEVLHKGKEASMFFCIGCHKNRKASVACNFCHELTM